MAIIESFLNEPILNWMFVLTVFLCGYLLYLKITIKQRKTTSVEVLLNVLAFGVIVLGIIYAGSGFLSFLTGNGFLNNIYIEYALHIAIILSSFLIFQHHMRYMSFSLNKILLMILLYIALTIIYFFILEIITLSVSIQ